jgi:hypothetical protein
MKRWAFFVLVLLLSGPARADSRPPDIASTIPVENPAA